MDWEIGFWDFVESGMQTFRNCYEAEPIFILLLYLKLWFMRHSTFMSTIKACHVNAAPVLRSLASLSSRVQWVYECSDNSRCLINPWLLVARIFYH